jgi:hypothetical protein
MLDHLSNSSWKRVAPLALLLSACAAANVTVTPAERAVAASPKPANCRIEFYRTSVPDLAYDEIATIRVYAGNDTDAEYKAAREQACALGADAVIVKTEPDAYHAVNWTAFIGTAVKFRPFPTTPGS